MRSRRLKLVSSNERPCWAFYHATIVALIPQKAMQAVARTRRWCSVFVEFSRVDASFLGVWARANIVSHMACVSGIRR